MMHKRPENGVKLTISNHVHRRYACRLPLCETVGLSKCVVLSLWKGSCHSGPGQELKRVQELHDQYGSKDRILDVCV